MSDVDQNGTVIEQREYTDEEMHALIDGTMTDFDEGDLVSGTVVKVERDEVLLDIGYKSEGVIPARELSIRKDANPADIVSVGDADRGPRPPEGRQGRPSHPLQEARRVRARLEPDRREVHLRRERRGRGHRGRQGRSHPRHRPARLPAGVPRRPPSRQGPRRLHRHAPRGTRHRDGPQPQQRRPLAPRRPRRGPQARARRDPRQAAEGHDPAG